MLDQETAAAVREAVRRVLECRETVPGDLPYPPTIDPYALAAAYPDADPQRSAWTKEGRALTRAVRQIYIAGYFAGRACDGQIGAQVREALGIVVTEATTKYHPHIGVAVCIVCDQAPDHRVHGEEQTGGGGGATR